MDPAAANGSPGEGFSVSSEPPPESDEAAIARLARLSPLNYDRVRDAEAELLGCRVTTLDTVVRPMRGGDTAPGQGRMLHLPAPEPWPQPVCGAALLDELATFIVRYVFLPPGAGDALAPWALHTHCFTCFEHSGRLDFTSPEKRCGKTMALDVLGLLVCKALSFTWRGNQLRRPSVTV
jgi:putative DNA primase/helicase